MATRSKSTGARHGAAKIKVVVPKTGQENCPKLQNAPSSSNPAEIEGACQPNEMSRNEAVQTLAEFHRQTEAQLKKLRNNESASDPTKLEEMDAKTRASLLL